MNLLTGQPLGFDNVWTIERKEDWGKAFFRPTLRMEALYDQAIQNMENTVHILAQRVPQPQRVPYKDSFVFRHVEKTINQALVQKLARLVSMGES